MSIQPRQDTITPKRIIWLLFATMLAFGTSFAYISNTDNSFAIPIGTGIILVILVVAILPLLVFNIR